MASSSGTKFDDMGLPRSLSKRLTRTPTMVNPNVDETVPSSLSSIAPILRVANEIEKDNRRVAYLCKSVSLFTFLFWLLFFALLYTIWSWILCL